MTGMYILICIIVTALICSIAIGYYWSDMNEDELKGFLALAFIVTVSSPIILPAVIIASPFAAIGIAVHKMKNRKK